MSAPASLLVRRGRVFVSPKPVTLLETSAILKALQSFGPVSHFLNPRYVPALESQSVSKFYVGFKNPETLDKDPLFKPFMVDVGHDAVDLEVADPFDVRGFWDRKKVERKTFTCRVYVDSGTRYLNRSRRIVEANPYHGPFRVDRLAVSFQDLMRQGAPSPEFADCVQKRQVSEADRTRFEQEAQRRSFYSTADDGEVTGGLMDTWRENIRSEAAIE